MIIHQYYNDNSIFINITKTKDDILMILTTHIINCQLIINITNSQYRVLQKKQPSNLNSSEDS
jgi:hypothetical protein